DLRQSQYAFTSQFALEHPQGGRQRHERLGAVLRNANHVFDLQSSKAELVIRRLDTHDHVLFQNVRRAFGDVRWVVTVDTNAMANVASLEMWNSLALNGRYDVLEQVRNLEAGLDNVIAAQNALFDSAVIFADFRGRLTQTRPARHVGPIVTVSSADVEANEIALLELAIGRLHVDHRTAIAKSDASDNRRRIVPCKTRIEFTKHLTLRDAFGRDLESRIDSKLGR